jgi:Rieske Fe-S protein
MERRDFLQTCALAGGSAGIATWWTGALASQPARSYPRARLVDGNGEPIRAKRLVVNRNYLFYYPYAGTPCFLLALDRSAARTALTDAGGQSYSWDGGVGPGRSIVAYSAICAHKLAYPAREISFIRYQERPSPTSKGGVIHCCAEHSVYDPAAGAKVVSGPAPQPLAAIVLDYDPKHDELAAIGTIGAEQFAAFFAKYEFKLGIELGAGKAQLPVGATTACREMSQVCRQTVQC